MTELDHDIVNRQQSADHLFINYATEDGEFAEWLTLRLTTEGYKVWCDRIKLLGGESGLHPYDWTDKVRRVRRGRPLPS
jgi:hypothetical protein